MLHLQKFLKEHPDNWITLLRDKPYSLLINAEDDLVLFKYIQFESDFSIPLVREARGIILQRNSWDVVAYSFEKFFNVGESLAYDIDFSKSKVFEKVDGSLIRVYFHNGSWRVATSGTIDASNANAQHLGLTFRDLFDDVISPDEFEVLVSRLVPEYTYMFELVHPASQVVVDYKGKKELVFLASRHNRTFELKDVSDIEPFFSDFPMIRFPKKFEMNDVSDLKELSEIADKHNVEGNEFEGFIVNQIESGFIVGQVKIKSPKYVVLHHLTGGDRKASANKVVEVFLNGEEDEFEAYLEKLPEYVREEYSKLKDKYDGLISDLDRFGKYYKENQDKFESRKDFALDIQKNVPKCLQGLVFTYVDKDIGTKDIFRNLPLRRLRRILR